MNSNICHIIQSNSVTTLENVESAIQKAEFLAIRSRLKNNRWFHWFQQQLKPVKTGSDRYRTVQIFICILVDLDSYMKWPISSLINTEY